MTGMENNAAGSGSLVAVFAQLEDPRVSDGQRHRLCDILVIALCTVLCGREEFTAMERIGKAKAAWLRTFLELPFGIPSHDTFRAVLSTLDSKQLAQALIAWTENVREKLGRPEIVAIDGKSTRRSVAKGPKPPRIWSTPGRWTTACAWAGSRRPRKATRSPPCRCSCANSNWPAAL